MSLTNFIYTLSWSDFSQVPARPAGEAEDAEINVRFGHSYNFASDKNAVVITSAEVTISCTPDCWVVSSRMNNDLLRHEQGHYDITALGAREFYTGLLQLKAPSVQDIKTKIARLNGQVQEKIQKANTRYDKQTSHSQNGVVQQMWEQRIATEMKKPDGSPDNLP